MTAPDRTDEAIRQDVLDRLAWDPEVEGSPLRVDVREAVVTLGGTARAYARVAAERVARAVDGVRAVDNRIDVRDPLAPDDGELARLAAAALAADPAVPADRIAVTVRDGIVELTGEVDRGSERAAAEAAVDDLPGTVDIRNRIAVKGPPASAEAIAAAIEEAFVAAARAAAAGIAVRVVEGRVTLSGTVRSLDEREMAERVAWRAAGITGVTDELRVVVR